MKFRLHPGQLEIDFRIPAKNPLTVSEVAEALWTSDRMTNSKVYELILEGKFGSIDISRVDAEREEYRIPLENFIHYLNGKYSDALYWQFPASDVLSVKQVKDNLGVSHETVYRYIDDGEFPHATNFGRTGKQPLWKIPIADLVAFVNRRRVGAYIS